MQSPPFTRFRVPTRYILPTDLSETFLSLRRNKLQITTNLHKSSCKVPVLFTYFNET